MLGLQASSFPWEWHFCNILTLLFDTRNTVHVPQILELAPGALISKLVEDGGAYSRGRLTEGKGGAY